MILFLLGSLHSSEFRPLSEPLKEDTVVETPDSVEAVKASLPVVYNEYPYPVCDQFVDDADDPGFCKTCGWIDGRHWRFSYALVVKMANTPLLNSGAERLASSTLAGGTLIRSFLCLTSIQSDKKNTNENGCSVVVMNGLLQTDRALFAAHGKDLNLTTSREAKRSRTEFGVGRRLAEIKN
jgi:hypothetical protein